jgi:CRP-like cAMP-binding protein
MAFSVLATAPASDKWRQLLEELYQNRNATTLKRGQFIPLHPYQVFIVSRGIVQLSTLCSTGDEGILGLICPSMPFGIPLSQLASYDAIALTDVVLMQVHITEIEQSPQLAQSLLQTLMRRLQQTERLLAIAGDRRVGDRLQWLLDFLRVEIGQVTPQGVRLSVRLTHQQIAGFIGTTRVTVTRLLGEYRVQGWLSVDPERHLLFTNSSLSL